MNYRKIYERIIENRIANDFIGYTENHHIVPRCLDGSDNQENLVRLSAREHFICHLLLTKIYIDGPNYHKMIKAFMMMLFCKSDNQSRHISSRKFEELRKSFAKMQSESQSGKLNSQYGIKRKWISNGSESRKIKIDEDIPVGWILGIVNPANILKRKELELAKESKRKEKSELKIKYVSQLKDWYEIYKSVGFDEFVKMTGYKFSKPNLVQTFAANLDDFVPQNGKSRK